MNDRRVELPKGVATRSVCRLPHALESCEGKFVMRNRRALCRMGKRCTLCIEERLASGNIELLERISQARKALEKQAR